MCKIYALKSTDFYQIILFFFFWASQPCGLPYFLWSLNYFLFSFHILSNLHILIQLSFEELSLRKDSDAGKDWRRKEKGMTEDKMVGWHHQLYAPEFEQAPGDGEGQVSLVCCSPWGCKESDMTEWLNNNHPCKEPACWCRTLGFGPLGWEDSL